ncbi:hypothetical protein DFR24_1187 [Panacagrimonas perspica]|uniref:Uncharacterized protein n=1 Tax=Panacagrimonas perspica TaxID=381431 RepID=A0A4S3K4T1_9GAMM|nr:hypothetical protein [Panacagrimonas perspica]TDU31805.1 hypothetical protein DFR24_1187 [Panacagrimonas perspica]THD02988.1 hypothetical protein B1810_10315 [Panacagrimonas perspica]
MRIPSHWPLLLMQVPLAFLFCHEVLGYDLWLSAFLTALTLNPLTLMIPALITLHAMVNAPSTMDSVTLLIPVAAIGTIAWLARTPLPPRAVDGPTLPIAS